MGEKFKKAFSVPGNQHTDGAPLIIEQGTLLKSNDSDKVLAQLVLRNITPKEIAEAKVSINVFGEQWTQIGETIDAEMKGLEAGRDQQFGGGHAIPVTVAGAHAISCRCKEVRFADG